METLRKFIIGIIGLFMSVGITILTTVKGYGLSIDSWPWVVGGTGYLFIFVGLITVALIKPS
ncbi:MAG: hypothetical protein GY718_10695 [Lentisphaerae bacterium]|nr:hypothetical protein [Lentisphaerota bacterium]